MHVSRAVKAVKSHVPTACREGTVGIVEMDRGPGHIWYVLGLGSRRLSAHTVLTPSPPPRRRQIDERTYERCSVPDEREFLAACGLSPAQVSFPIPVMPLSALPDIERVINASQAVLADLQAQYHRVIILG